MSVNDKERLKAKWGKRQRRVDDYMVARNGDHLMIPYECDNCIFYKLRGTLPVDNSAVDDLLLDCIRRANLDSFWSRARGTVEGNCRKAKQIQNISESLNMPGPFITQQMLPPHDYCGYQMAVVMLKYSLNTTGVNDTNIQFDTVRKLRAVYSNFVRVCPESVSVPLVLGTEKGQYQRLNNDVCGSLWFSRFMEGMRKRMGQITKSNKTMSPALVRALLELSDSRMSAEENPEDRDRWVVFNTYAVVCYVISLRGNEGFLLDLGALRRYFNRGIGEFVTIPLLGMFKGESDDMAHLIPCCERTASGIDIRKVLMRLIANKEMLGIIDGPAISDTKGFVLDPSDIDEMFHELLIEIFQERKDIFPPDIEEESQIKENFQCFRTFRRTSNTRAKNMKVTKTDQETVNRWRVVEKAAGKRPNLPMDQHYSSFQDLLQPFLNYTSKM